MRILVVRFFEQALLRSFVEDLRSNSDVIVDLLCTCIDQQCSMSQPDLYDNVFHLNRKPLPWFVNHWRVRKYIKVQECLDSLRLKRLLASLPRYDICHIHYLIPDYGKLANNFRNVADRLVLSVWGSDFYKATPEACSILTPLIFSADVVTFANEQTAVDFALQYPPSPDQSFVINRFGLGVLDNLKDMRNDPRAFSREVLGLPINAMVVSCGTNSSPNQQHKEMIQSLVEVRHLMPASVFFVFPMTYGASRAYVEEIELLLAGSGLPYKILDKYLNNEQVAHLCKATDVLVQVQLTDQLSGSMQEHLYAGSVVVTGEWLPYEVFNQNGVFMVKVPTVACVGTALLDVIGNLVKYQTLGLGNDEKIWRLSSREVTATEWLRLYKATN